MEDVKSTDKLNLNLNENVDLLSKEKQAADLEFHKNATAKESAKKVGKDIMQASIDSYKPKNFIESKINQVVLTLCIFVAPLGFLLSLIMLLNSKKKPTEALRQSKKGTAIAGLVLSSLIMLGVVYLIAQAM